MIERRVSPSSESGNVFIYIIGAIFLLGVLVVVIRGSSTPGSGISQETLILKASQVRAYSAELERAVTFIMQNGHSETEISFAHPNHSSTYGTYGSNPTAEVFHPNGGGAEWRDNDSDIQIQDEDWVFTGTSAINDLGTTNALDLVAVLPHVTEDFCFHINDQLGIDYSPLSDIENVADAYILTPYSGTFPGFISAFETPSREYKSEGCFQEGDVGTMPVGTYFYFKVLLAR